MTEEDKAFRSVIEGNGEFTKNLYKALATQRGNVFFSPISVHAILSLASQGSVNQTRETFAKVLHVPNLKTTANGYKDVMVHLNSVKDITLLMANKIYLKENYELQETFKLVATQQFLSEVELLDFTQSETAAKSINSWVEEKTNNKIRNLIDSQNLSDRTRLILVNAIYFKGMWEKPFESKDTRIETFYLHNTGNIDVDMMHINKKFYFKNDKDLDAKVLELPYVNKAFSLIVILPNYRNGINELEEALARTDLTKITEGMAYVEVEVDLPKFKIEQTIDLEQPLTKIGLGEIFNQRNIDLSGMINGSEPLYVSKAVQMVFIDVNEEGTEAAAATGLQWMYVSSPPPPEEFIADHPFIIMLVEKQSSTLNILFFGRISEPMY